VFGIIYASITTLQQIDLKKIIAYSSVGHMGLVTVFRTSKTRKVCKGQTKCSGGHISMVRIIVCDSIGRLKCCFTICFLKGFAFILVTLLYLL